VRIAVLHPQTAFSRGGAETHTEALVRALRTAGHEAELVSIAGKWYPAWELAHQMAVWRSFDITESNGLKVDAVIALKFPAYLVQHERKIVWLIHQHRSAYELWDHPRFADLSLQEDGPAVRDMVWQSDRVALGEAKRIFTNSRNVQDRLWGSMRLASDVLYHPSPPTEALLGMQPGPIGDYVFVPGRLEALKRQSLVIDAMRHVKSDVRLVLVGSGPDEQALRDQVRSAGLDSRVSFEIGVSDERLHQLYLGALAVHYGPFDEDYGYVTLEGFAAQRPVVTTGDAGGPLEFVSDGETGLVTAPEPAAIAGAFDRLFADRALAQRLGAAGKAVVRERVPAWPDVVSRLLD
jgi:glycosyltransferase involved in cell wall biosynthesis